MYEVPELCIFLVEDQMHIKIYAKKEGGKVVIANHNILKNINNNNYAQNL